MDILCTNVIFLQPNVKNVAQSLKDLETSSMTLTATIYEYEEIFFLFKSQLLCIKFRKISMDHPKRATLL